MKLKFPKSRERLRREAAGWLARLHSGRDPDVEEGFRRWREADPAHAEAFARIERSWNQAALLRHSPDRLHPRRAVLPPPRYPMPAIAAGLALVVAAAILWGTGWRFGPVEALTLSTRVGEIRKVTLADGTMLTLDTATRVRLEEGREPRALVETGRVRFDVPAKARQFLVEAGGMTAATVEGTLDVEIAGSGGRLAMLSGSADVRWPGQRRATGLAAGETMASASGRIGTVKRVGREPDWTSGMLQFDGTTLAAAAAAANRYSQRKIILGEGLAELRVTGASKAGDTPGLAASLARAFDLTLDDGRDGALILSRRSVRR